MTVYKGFTKNDLPDATGEVIFANGDHYIGNLKDGLFEGVGKLTYTKD